MRAVIGRTRTGRRTIKAIECEKYGPPDVLRAAERAVPVPKSNEIRIKIHSAVATPSDCAFRRANPFFIRFMYGLRKPKYAVLGVELAGIVDAVGREATRFKPGDRVFGLSTRSFGAYAEYICLPEDGLLAKVPSGTSCDEAVGICDGAATSLVFLRDVARIRPGQRALINGASGAVGIYAVQLAKHYGAEVTGVCSGANAELVLWRGHPKRMLTSRPDAKKET